MNENRETLKAELTQVIQLGKDSKKLVEAQGTLLNKIKKGIYEELAMASAPKSSTVKKFLWFTITEETREGLEHIEALQADLRVILGYEALLNSTQSDAQVAKMNLEVLNAKS